MDILRRMHNILGNVLIYCLLNVAGRSAVIIRSLSTKRHHLHFIRIQTVGKCTTSYSNSHNTKYFQAIPFGDSVSESDFPTHSHNACYVRLTFRNRASYI
jgi:hypothetical protein